MNTPRLPSGVDPSALDRLHRCETDLLRRAARLQKIVNENPRHPDARGLLELASQLLELTWATSNLRTVAQTPPPEPSNATAPGEDGAEGDNVVPFPRRDAD